MIIHQPIDTHQNEAMETEKHIVQNNEVKKTRKKTKAPPLKYDIVSVVMNQKANISFGNLIVAAPALGRKLAAASRPKRIPVEDANPDETMALIEDEDISTTAVYSKVDIGEKSIKTLIDCDAAKTCMSKALADTLGLDIDAASESVFTLGNGTKQPALGVIYDVPICVKNRLIIPCTVEVLPSCPNPLIIGNNWLSRAKARIDFNSSTLKVAYKNKKAELEITFSRKKSTVPRISSYEQVYEYPVSSTNTKPNKQVHFEDESQESDSTEEESEEISEDEDEIEEEPDEIPDESLLLLEDDEKKIDVQVSTQMKEMLLEAPPHGMTLAANTSKIIWIKKPKNEHKNLIYNLEITNPKISESMGYFDPCSSLVVNRKSLDIRIYNRSAIDILLDPGEEIGVIEKLDPQEDSIVQAYNIHSNHHLCVLESFEFNLQNKNENDETKVLEPEKCQKLDVGELQ